MVSRVKPLAVSQSFLYAGLSFFTHILSSAATPAISSITVGGPVWAERLRADPSNLIRVTPA